MDPDAYHDTAFNYDKTTKQRKASSTNSSATQKLPAQFKFCKQILNLHNLRHLKMYFNT